MTNRSFGPLNSIIYIFFYLLPFAYCLLVFAFCLLSFGFRLLPFNLTAMGVYPHTDGDRGALGGTCSHRESFDSKSASFCPALHPSGRYHSERNEESPACKQEIRSFRRMTNKQALRKFRQEPWSRLVGWLYGVGGLVGISIIAILLAYNANKIKK